MKEFIEGIRFVLVASIFVGIVWVGHVIMLTQRPVAADSSPRDHGQIGDSSAYASRAASAETR